MHPCEPLKCHAYDKSANQTTACAQPLVLILDGAWVNPTGASVGLLAAEGSRTLPSRDLLIRSVEICVWNE